LIGGIASGENNDGNVWTVPAGALESLQALAVGQAEIAKKRVEAPVLQMLDGLVEAATYRSSLKGISRFSEDMRTAIWPSGDLHRSRASAEAWVSSLAQMVPMIFLGLSFSRRITEKVMVAPNG
jgi:hypothetical protein